MLNTLECKNCYGTGSVYCGFGSYLDEDNYDTCEECSGEGVIESEEE